MPSGQLINGNILGETCSRDNPSAEAEFYCLWQDRWWYAATLVGGLMDQGSGLQYYPPGTYGDLTGLICNDVKIEKMGQLAGGGSTPMAKLVASYGIPHCHDPSSSNLLDLAEITIEASGEGLPLPRESVTWGDDAPSQLVGVSLRDQDIQPSLMTPFAEMSIRLRYCQSWQLDTLSKLIGHVNQSSVDLVGSTFDAEQLLFVGVGLSQTLTPQGYEQFERNVKIGIRRTDDNGTLRGWNHLYIPDYDVWATTDPPLYDSGDFSILFRGN